VIRVKQSVECLAVPIEPTREPSSEWSRNAFQGRHRHPVAEALLDPGDHASGDTACHGNVVLAPAPAST
jgi:hypothetical protein